MCWVTDGWRGASQAPPAVSTTVIRVCIRRLSQAIVDVDEKTMAERETKPVSGAQLESRRNFLVSRKIEHTRICSLASPVSGTH